MDNSALIAMTSLAMAAVAVGLGSIGTAIGMGHAIANALTAIAQQPDEGSTVARTLFVGLAMIESLAIYCFVVAMILLFANPFWDHFVGL